MLKIPNLDFHVLAFSPPSVESIEEMEISTALREYARYKDDVALLSYMKMWGAYTMSPGALEQDDTSKVFRGVVDAVLDILKREVDEPMREVDRRGFIEALDEVEETGAPLFVMYRKMPYYVTWVRINPSYALTNVIGYKPRPKMDERESRLGIAIPLRWLMPFESVPYEEIDPTKLGMSVKPRLVRNEGGWFKRSIIIPVSVPLVNKEDSTFTMHFPIAYVPTPLNYISVLEAIAASCPAAIKVTLMMYYMNVTYSPGDYPEFAKKYLERIYEGCKQAGRVLGSLSLAVYHTPYGNIHNMALINAFYWIAKHNSDSVVAEYYRTTTKIAEMFQKFRSDSPVENANFIQAEKMIYFTSAMFFIAGNTIEPYVNPQKTRYYAFIGMLPEIVSGVEQKTAHPLITFVSKNMVVPSLPRPVYYDGFIKAMTADEVERALEYLYFEKGLTHPTDYEEVGFDRSKLPRKYVPILEANFYDILKKFGTIEDYRNVLLEKVNSLNRITEGAIRKAVVDGDFSVLAPRTIVSLAETKILSEITKR